MHIPVLKDEVVNSFSYLENKSDAIFVDGTLGLAGHSLSLLKKFKSAKIKIVGIDKDKSALEKAKEIIKKEGLEKNFYFIHDDFKNIGQILANLKIKEIDGALVDLGVSSMQLDDKTRGFSFADPEEKLDMRMDQDQELSALYVVNKYTESHLEHILRNYGEESFSKIIAKNICKKRKHRMIETIGDLLYCIESAIPNYNQAKMKIHPATKTFQAIRIEVNQELKNLDDFISDTVKLLRPGGRLAVISFHSLEDRIIKNSFRDLEKDCVCPPKAPICICDKKSEGKVITSKPIIANPEEIKINRRSRSAKLRVFEKM